MVHHSPIEYNIVPSMNEELNYFEEFLSPGSGVEWEAPMAYLIKRTPFTTAYGDACLHLAGGYSIGLECVWTLLHLKDNRGSNLIATNILEYLTVITDYSVAYAIVTTMDVTDDPHPVLLSMADNTPAHSWTNHMCKSSIIGKLLGFYLLSPHGL